MVEVAEISPYIYCASFFFASSAISSDLLFIRFSLSGGFLFVTLASLSGQSSDGSFEHIPISDGILDIPMFVNFLLFVLNTYICLRLIYDERPTGKLNAEEHALFRFFQARCGCTQLQFQVILDNGEFLELPTDTVVPGCGSNLYLILEGIVSCRAKFEGDLFGKSFLKRSGQFFDIKLFNLFSIPIGFDNQVFHAKTVSPTKFFRWNIHGLIAMREAQSPSLREYWEYMVMRSLTETAVQSHLKAHDTLYDSLQIPEHETWLKGAPSRDFWKEEKPVGDWKHVERQWAMISSSLLQIIPPRGVRQRPGMMQGATNPKQSYIEMLCKVADAQETGSASTFRFLKDQQQQQQQQQGEGPMTAKLEPPEEESLPPPTNLFRQSPQKTGVERV